MQPHRQTIAIPGRDDLIIQVTDDHSRTLIDPQSQVAYHSGSGAAAETRHVYLSNSGVQERLSSGEPTSVLEIGFGTGLGMLMTVDAAIRFGTPLRFDSVESRVLGREVLSPLRLEDQLVNRWLAERFLIWRDSLGDAVAPGHYVWQVEVGVEARLLVGDARTMAMEPKPTYHAIYFDPFAPSENPELWQPEFLRKIRPLLHGDGVITTYCVSRLVRENFAAAGFAVRRVRGPLGGKREVLIATVA